MRAAFHNSTPCKKVASIKKYIEVAGMLRMLKRQTAKNQHTLTIMVNVKTDRNQALLKPIVGIIVGIVKNNNQGMP